MPYDKELRVIGQALEAKRVDVFELKNDGERYMIHGTPEKGGSLRARLRDMRERMRGQAAESHFSYDAAELVRLESAGKLRREKRDRLPDFYRLSNALRTIGRYLDRKEAELLEIHKRPLSVTILYRDRDGHPNLEERSIASFYSLFIELYGKRTRRQ